jgi:phage-related protein
MALDMTTALTIKAKVDGINQIQGLEKALGAADKQANGLGTAFSKLGGIAKSTGALLAGVGTAAVGGLAVLGKKAIDSADNLNDLSQRTGVGVEALSKFGAAAEDSGSSLDEVAKAMGKLAKGIVDPASKANEALRSIGVSSVDARGKVRSVDEVMLDIADKFSKLPDGAQKTALAMEIFGKSGANLIPMLNGGREAMSQYSATITTDMAQAADKFNDAINMIMRELAGPFNQAITASLPYITQLAMQLGESLPGAVQALTPIITGLLQGLTQLGQWFGTLSPQAQTFVVSAAGLTAAFIALAPAVTAILAVFTSLGPLLAGIPAVIAGFAGAIGPLVAALGSLGQILIGVFTGPVGWVALAVAAGVAIYAFRDQIGQAFKAIGAVLQQAAQGFKTVFIDPVVKGFQAVVQFVNVSFVQPLSQAITQLVQSIANTFKAVTQAITAPFQAAFNSVRGIVNQILNGIGSAIGSVVNAINGVIRGANSALARLRLPQIPQLPMPSIPRFAEGGVVSGPTLAMVGEGGEPEYIVPQSKAGAFAANWMAGVRGPAAIPRFAEGGMVVPTSASVSIQTGPVMQMNGANYVTTQDLSSAVQAGVNQTLSLLAGDSRVRRSLGLA